MASKLKILLVEDNQFDAALILRELNKSGFDYDAQTVKTKAEYENICRTDKPDLILSDYSLPNFHGIAAFEIKMEVCPDIPFILISGAIGEETSVELIKSGVTDYVMKDKLYTLKSKIERALKDTQASRNKLAMEEMLKIRNQKLTEIAFLQSHQVRVPVAHILGLYNLFNFSNLNDPMNAEVLSRVKKIAENLDEVIREINIKITEVGSLR